LEAGTYNFLKTTENFTFISDFIGELGAGNLLSAAIPRALLSHRLLWDFHYHQG